MKRSVTIAVVLLGLIALAGCDRATSTSAPATVHKQGTVAELSQSAKDRAEKFESWLDNAHSTSIVEATDYYSDGDLADLADDLRGDADDYPEKGSKVPGTLRAAAKQLDAADKALSRRQYKQAGVELRRAAKALAPMKGQVQADWRKVETQTGLQLSDSPWGTVSDGAGEEYAEVEKWIDGDTVDTDRGRVRLIGIDTPELEDQCSRAEEAKEYAETLAPAGSQIALVNPDSVVDKDKYGRLLRYVDVLNRDDDPVADVGYSLLLSNLAKARYDSLDGYQWHPRERAYRSVSADPDRKPWLLCHWESAILAKVADGSHDNDDDDQRDRHELRHLVAVTFRLPSKHDQQKVVARAKKAHRDSDELEREIKRDHDSAGGGGGSFNVPGWLCPTRWC